MASKGKFERNEDGVLAILNSVEVQEALTEEANRIRGRAGEGFEAYVKPVVFNTPQYKGRTRCVAYVKAVSEEARNSCLDDNTLLKAVRTS